MIPIDTWVQIHKIVLTPSERSGNLPDETKQVPLELWTKGYLQVEANLGDIVTIKTVTGRIETGTLLSVHPSYRHNYGDFVPELLEISRRVKKAMSEEADDE